MSLQRRQDRRPGYEHLDGLMCAGQTNHVQQALASLRGDGSMSVSEIWFKITFYYKSFMTCCIAAAAAQAYFLQVGQFCYLRDGWELSFHWDRGKRRTRAVVL